MQFYDTVLFILMPFNCDLNPAMNITKVWKVSCGHRQLSVSQVHWSTPYEHPVMDVEEWLVLLSHFSLLLSSFDLHLYGRLTLYCKRKLHLLATVYQGLQNCLLCHDDLMRSSDKIDILVLILKTQSGHTVCWAMV